jgi:hypothetical protein
MEQINMIKKRLIITILITIMILLSSCEKPQYLNNDDTQGADILGSESDNIDLSNENVEIPRPDRKINLSFAPDNVNEKGIACVYGGVLYYTSPSGDILRYIDPQTGFGEIMCNDPLCNHAGDNALCLANYGFFTVWTIITDGKSLYVYAGKDNGIYDNFKGTYKPMKYGIYEIDVKTNKFRTVTEWDGMEGRLIPTIKIQDDYIYYSRRTNIADNNNALYRVKKSGGSAEQLSNTNISFQQFEIVGDKVYYRSLESIIYRSDFTMTNTEKVSENVTYFTIKDKYIYTSYEIWENVQGNYSSQSSKGAFRYEIRRINLDDLGDNVYICTSVSGIPIFSGSKYYYMPYEPVNTATHIKNGKEYDILNNNNGKIIVADIQTNEIIQTYQDTDYFGFGLFYADGNIMLTETGETESGEVRRKICIMNGGGIEYYDIYEKQSRINQMY